MWIFGYGSLIWKQNFPYEEMKTCTIRGYRRVFYQGSTDHRGVPGSPGRVVTLIPDPEGEVTGVAFLLNDETREATLDALDYREKGGYTRVDIDAIDLATQQPIPERCLCYIADKDNEEFLGHADDADIATQIYHSVGPSGPNIDYLLNLSRGLRQLGATDEHVFALEKIVLDLRENAKVEAL
jgi:glutathione-specific gamma-glutamylcyclotransferase